MSKLKHDMDYSCVRENCGGTCFGCTLGVCRGCGQYEGGLATECPGYRISEKIAQAIYAGEVDYIGGKGWVDGPKKVAVKA